MDRESINIQVFVRLRPLIAIEALTDRVVQILPDNRTVRVAHDSYNHMQIKFDQAFDPDKEQSDIYSHFQSIVPKVLTGYNLTIFAYGQTGSGKTYTMFGKLQNEEKNNVELDKSQYGVIPRAIEAVFAKVGDYRKVDVFCSFLQIYNEKIYDLLQEGEKPKPLNIHQSKAEGVFVQGLTEFGVSNPEDCMQLLLKGVKNRVIRQTSMNAKSSRSHSIFQLLLEVQDHQGNFFKSRLNLCDLAGSQKINKKEYMGQAQLKELKNINLSLTTLGKVIYALSSNDKKASGAFRQSKLTRLLQSSLTGNTYTFIMANLSPSSKNLDETVNTLKFVERANHIVLKVKPTDTNGSNPDHVVKLQREIDYLKELLSLKKQGVNPEKMPEEIKTLLRENQHFKNEFVPRDKLELLKKQNQNYKSKYVPKDKLEELVKQNQNMKKQIHNLQVRLNQTEGTQSSLDSVYQQERIKQINKERYKREFYMPSSRGPSSRNSQDSKRVSSSLLQAGNSIVFQHSTIEDSPSRNREKKGLAQRLQDFEDKRKRQQYRLMEEYEQFDKKVRGRYSPPKGSPKGKVSGKGDESMVIKSRKKVDYSDKIKELEARLFKK